MNYVFTMPRKSFGKGTFSSSFLTSLLSMEENGGIEIIVLDHGTNIVPEKFKPFLMQPSVIFRRFALSGNIKLETEGQICQRVMNSQRVADSNAFVRGAILRKEEDAKRAVLINAMEYARIERQNNSPYYKGVCELFGTVYNFDHTDIGLTFGVGCDTISLNLLLFLSEVVGSTDIEFFPDPDERNSIVVKF